MSQLDPPNRPAKWTRQNVLPWKHAKSTREHDPPNSLARDPPFPAQDPPGRTWLASLLPPPPPAPPTEQGGGGKEPTRPACASWTGTFTFPWMFTYPYRTQHIRILYRADKTVYKYITLGEGKVARRGWGAGLLPAPLKGVFCIIRVLQEVSRLAILTRIGYKHI
jgi:hypothetical protein